MPDSTIVVETRTSNFFSQKSTTTCSRAVSDIWPWAVAILASGMISRRRAAARSMDSTRLWM